MQRLGVLALGSGLFFLTSAVAVADPADATDRIDKPVWTTSPAGGVLPTQFPIADYRSPFDLLCRVRSEMIEDCRAIEPSPPAEMLSAALTAARVGRIAAVDGDNRPTDGREVLVRIGFPLIVAVDPPSAPPSSIVVGVIWTEHPTAAQFVEYYPVEAQRERATGRAALDCIVSSDGRVACRVLTETPAGQGFGDAALRISRYFRAADRTQSGEITAGKHTRISLTFNPPQ